MKTHLNLATTDLSESVRFYSTLLDARPAKHLDDYALFVTEQPGLELALDLARSVSRSHDSHFGICVESLPEVELAIDRLERAGLVTSVEHDEACCYANQTKVWATDPDGRRWEIYTVLEDTSERNGPDITCCQTDNEARSCCVEALG